MGYRIIPEGNPFPIWRSGKSDHKGRIIQPAPPGNSGYDIQPLKKRLPGKGKHDRFRADA
jgi:hypothetical protein